MSVRPFREEPAAGGLPVLEVVAWPVKGIEHVHSAFIHRHQSDDRIQLQRSGIPGAEGQRRGYSGFDENLQRAIRENSALLGFGSAGFEQE